MTLIFITITEKESQKGQAKNEVLHLFFEVTDTIISRFHSMKILIIITYGASNNLIIVNSFEILTI